VIKKKVKHNSPNKVVSFFCMLFVIYQNNKPDKFAKILNNTTNNEKITFKAYNNLPKLTNNRTKNFTTILSS
jgi:hypothetical protein